MKTWNPTQVSWVIFRISRRDSSPGNSCFISKRRFRLWLESCFPFEVGFEFQICRFLCARQLFFCCTLTRFDWFRVPCYLLLLGEIPGRPGVHLGEGSSKVSACSRSQIPSMFAFCQALLSILCDSSATCPSSSLLCSGEVHPNLGNFGCSEKGRIERVTLSSSFSGMKRLH